MELWPYGPYPESDNSVNHMREGAIFDILAYISGIFRRVVLNNSIYYAPEIRHLLPYIRISATAQPHL